MRFFLKKGANNIIYHKNLELLWECCQIPDFQKKTYTHIDVVSKVFTFLTKNKKRIPNDYMKNQLKNLDKYKGNIDMIANQISNVRTWSYVANKKNWVENSDYWIHLTKNIEDSLSDKLHVELTRSFIDKRISVLSRGLKQDIKLNTEINEKEEVIIDGQLVGKLKGLKLNLEFTQGTLDTDIKSLKKAAREGVGEELKKRVKNIINSDEIVLGKNYKINWRENPIARLKKGKNYLYPDIEIIADEALDNQSKDNLFNFLTDWLKKYISDELNNLINLIKLENKNQYIRALAFRLYENNGVLKRIDTEEIINKIEKQDRKQLKGLGIKIGRYHIFLPRMLKPKAVELRILLWEFFNNSSQKNHVPRSGLNFLFDKTSAFNAKFLLLCGFERFKNFYIRVDILEKLFIKIIEKSKNGQFEINSEMINLIGCTRENFLELMSLMNYKKNKDKQDFFIYKGEKKSKKLNKFIKRNDSPFKKLETLGLK